MTAPLPAALAADLTAHGIDPATAHYVDRRSPWGADRKGVRRLADQYDIGTVVNRRMRIYTEEDVAVMQAHSTGKPGRPRKLSESLALAASAAEERAADAIRDGDSESAAVTLRLAGHMRRLANAHRASGNDPEQVS